MILKIIIGLVSSVLVLFLYSCCIVASREDKYMGEVNEEQNIKKD